MAGPTAATAGTPKPAREPPDELDEAVHPEQMRIRRVDRDSLHRGPREGEEDRS